MAMSTTSSLANFFSFLSISNSSPDRHYSGSVNLRLVPKSQPAPLVATWNHITPSSPTAIDFSNVVYPSLAHSNILFFKSAYNVQLIVGENDSEEKLVGRFRREVLKAGVLQECKRRRFFENKHDKIKRKARDAAKRNRKRWFKRPEVRVEEEQSKQEASHKEVDNWDDYQVDLPYSS